MAVHVLYAPHPHPSILNKTRGRREHTDKGGHTFPIRTPFKAMQMKNGYNHWQFVAMLPSGVILPSLGHLAFSGDTFECQNWDWEHTWVCVCVV